MVRLIDADTLTDKLIKEIEADTDKSIETSFAKSVCMIFCKAIEQQPTVDAVPVIRCKDCKHYINARDGFCISFARFGVNENDYCSRAERKEE